MKAVLGASSFIEKDFGRLCFAAQNTPRVVGQTGEITELAFVYDRTLKPESCSPKGFTLNAHNDHIRFSPGCEISYYQLPGLSTGIGYDVFGDHEICSSVRGSYSFAPMARALLLMCEVRPDYTDFMPHLVGRMMRMLQRKDPQRLWPGRIASAAILHRPSGNVYSGKNHAIVIGDLVNECGFEQPVGNDPAVWRQGFITEDSHFLDRREAYIVAERYDQIDLSIDRIEKNWLDSEWLINNA